MTDDQKLAYVKIRLSDGGEMPSDEMLIEYIRSAGQEILNWMYDNYQSVPDDVTEVPPKYEEMQIAAVVAGYTHAGSEGQDTHTENGVTRRFVFDDMRDYIRKNANAIVRVFSRG